MVDRWRSASDPAHNNLRKEPGVRDVLKSPIVIFALVCALIAAIGAPLFALGDIIP
jgi:hypothetical protein